MNILGKISSIPFKIHPSFHFFVFKYLCHLGIEGILCDPVLKFIVTHVSKGDCVIDVGANMGTYAYAISMEIGSSGQVFAFEANPETVLQLRKNIRVSNIYIESIALSSQKIEKKFYMHTIGAGPTSSLEYFDNLDADGEIKPTKVQCEILDSYCKSKQLVPSLIKIDVEGHEYQVIKGSVNVIKKYRPIIVFEFIEQWWEEKNINKIFDFFSPSYQLLRIEDGEDALKAYKNFRVEQGRDFRLSRNVNIACIPRELDTYEYGDLA